MNEFLINNAIICGCALLSFIAGAVTFFRPRKAVYGQMIVLGLGCIAIGRLYQLIKVMTGGDITDRFQMGALGVYGSFVFFFSANYGLMDSLADDGSKRFRKYRLAALAAPAAAIAGGAFACLGDGVSHLSRIMTCILTLFIIGTSYYNLKHIILPDVDYGIINCLKLCNGAVLVYCALCLAEAAAYNHMLLDYVRPISIALGAVILLIVPLLVWGYKKWTT